MRSPCVGRCGLNNNNYCVGCFRHIDEIAGWSSASDEYKQQVIDALPARKKAFTEQVNVQKND